MSHEWARVLLGSPSTCSDNSEGRVVWSDLTRSSSDHDSSLRDSEISSLSSQSDSNPSQSDSNPSQSDSNPSQSDFNPSQSDSSPSTAWLKATHTREAKRIDAREDYVAALMRWQHTLRSFLVREIPSSVEIRALLNESSFAFTPVVNPTHIHGARRIPTGSLGLYALQSLFGVYDEYGPPTKPETSASEKVDRAEKEKEREREREREKEKKKDEDDSAAHTRKRKMLHDEICCVCMAVGADVTCALGCRKAFHAECVGESSVPEGDWRCSECLQEVKLCYTCKQPCADAEDTKRCTINTCRKYFHKDCLDPSISSKALIVCPHHSCRVCKSTTRNFRSFHCSFCPVATHMKCVDTYLTFIRHNTIICWEHDLRENVLREFTNDGSRNLPQVTTHALVSRLSNSNSHDATESISAATNQILKDLVDVVRNQQPISAHNSGDDCKASEPAVKSESVDEIQSYDHSRDENHKDNEFGAISTDAVMDTDSHVPESISQSQGEEEKQVAAKDASQKPKQDSPSKVIANGVTASLCQQEIQPEPHQGPARDFRTEKIKQRSRTNPSQRREEHLLIAQSGETSNHVWRGEFLISLENVSLGFFAMRLVSKWSVQPFHMPSTLRATDASEADLLQYLPSHRTMSVLEPSRKSTQYWKFFQHMLSQRKIAVIELLDTTMYIAPALLFPLMAEAFSIDAASLICIHVHDKPIASMRYSIECV